MNRSSTRSTKERTVLVLLFALFALCGLARLNPFCLLEPDTPDYFFTSRALVTLEGYREIDHPARAFHAFRPPGLALLLAPLSLFVPYDVLAAKVLILGTAVLTLALVYGLCRRRLGMVSSMVVTLLVASSPYTLLHATEVLSEFPYLAVVLAVLFLVDRDDRPAGPGARFALGGLLALAPLLRTVGLALVAACAGWSLADRSRRRWLLPCSAAAAVNLAWILRNQRAGVPTYLTGITHDLSSVGVGAYASKSLDGAVYYLERLCGALLPGVFSGRPLYERFLLDPAPNLRGLGGAGLVLAGLVCILALVGSARRFRGDGALVTGYGALYLIALAAYPPRHERLVWPLVPLVWIYAAMGVDWWRSRLVGRVKASGAAICAVAGALVAWQAFTSASVVWTNLRWLRLQERFYQDDVPPMYYCDWQAAGRWLRDNTAPFGRVLTRHSDVGFTARRPQESVRFEESAPEELHRAIARFRARHLVVPSTLFGSLAPRHLFLESPVYSFRRVRNSGDVMILEVLPNREGIALSDDAGSPETLESCRRASARHPRRADLARRLAELLHEEGNTEEALATLDEFVRREGASVEVLKTRGAILLEEERFREALDTFRSASSLPDAELLSVSLERGIRRSEEELTAMQTLSPAERARRLARSARDRAGALLYEPALKEIERARRLAPNDPEVLLTYALVLTRSSRSEDAIPILERLSSSGVEPARELLARLGRERALVSGEGDPRPEEYPPLAARLIQEALPGRALALLERASERFPDSPEIRLRLADLYLLFGMPERSEPLYRKVLEVQPGNEEVQKGLEASTALLDFPGY